MSKKKILKDHLQVWQQIAIDLAEENDMLHAVNNEWWRATTKIAEFFYNQQTNKPTINKTNEQNDPENHRTNKRNLRQFYASEAAESASAI